MVSNNMTLFSKLKLGHKTPNYYGTTTDSPQVTGWEMKRERWEGQHTERGKEKEL